MSTAQHSHTFAATAATSASAAPSPANLPRQDDSSEVRQLKERIYQARDAQYPEVYHTKNLIPPTQLTDGVKAANRLVDALMGGQTIVCVADFDCDGATGAAIFSRAMNRMTDTLAKFKLPRAKIEIVIPDRFRYGYGLKPRLAEEKIKPLYPDVIVTVDNGISSHDAITWISMWKGVSPANETGAPDVIVTDHHAQGDTLPDAYAVVNPNRKDCPFPSKSLAGCGVAFYIVMLTQAILARRLKQDGRHGTASAAIAALQVSRYADLVAVGTVGDMVPLDANNRLLVKMGLERINRGLQMPARQSHTEGYLSFGVRALLEIAGVSYPVTASDLAFQVVARLNAIGRLEMPTAGIECLLADTQMIAGIEAKRCDDLNKERKAIQASMQNDADLAFAELTAQNPDRFVAGESSQSDSRPDAVVMHSDEWHPGVVGLVASKIKDRTGGSVICFAPESAPGAKPGTPEAEGDPEWLKGSGRSDNVHLRDTLAYVATLGPDLMMQFGGHARAAGLSLHRNDLNRFKRLFDQAVEHSLKTSPLINRTFDDGALPAPLRTHALAAWIERQPWGNQFPEPAFTQNFKVIRSASVGVKHQKLLVMDAGENPLTNSGPNNETVYPVTHDAVMTPMLWFFSLTEDNPVLAEPGSAIRVTYTLTINRYRGKNEVQMIARSVTPIGFGQ